MTFASMRFLKKSCVSLLCHMFVLPLPLSPANAVFEGVVTLLLWFSVDMCIRTGYFYS